jgi:hypothetical protein
MPDKRIVIDNLGLCVQGSHKKSGYISSLANRVADAFGADAVIKVESKAGSLLVKQSEGYTFVVEQQ